jgi:hypothetical protein
MHVCLHCNFLLRAGLRPEAAIITQRYANYACAAVVVHTNNLTILSLG